MNTSLTKHNSTLLAAYPTCVFYPGWGKMILLVKGRRLGQERGKKYLTNSCTYTFFSFDNTIYEQFDRVSMDSLINPVPATIILIEFENVIYSDLVKSGIFKFCRRYVEDTSCPTESFRHFWCAKKFSVFKKIWTLRLICFSRWLCSFSRPKNFWIWYWCFSRRHPHQSIY